VRGELDRMAATLATSALRDLVVNPRVSAADKAAVLSAVGERLETSERTMNLVHLLVANRRTGLIQAVARAFADLADRARGRVSVTVTAAIKLPAKSRQQVEARILETLHTEAEVTHRVDPEILGGLVIQVGSRVFDNSIRHHLARLRRAL